MKEAPALGKTAHNAGLPVGVLAEDAVLQGGRKGFSAFVWFCAAATQEFLTRNSMQMAAAIAFYCFFSLFPLSILIMIIYQLVTGSQVVHEDVLARAIGNFVPVSQTILAQTINEVSGTWDWRATGPLAFAGLVWASTAVFATLRKGINAAWGIWIPRAFLKERVMDLTLTAGAGLLFMMLLYSTPALRQIPESGQFFRLGLLSTLPSFGISFFGFAFLYWFLPHRRVRLQDVLFGAFLAAFAFEVAQGFFLSYSARREALGQVYGSLTGVAVLLGWLYLSAVLVLLGCLATAIYTHLIQRGFARHSDFWSFGLLPTLRLIRRKIVHAFR